MNKVAQLSTDERNELFKETATLMKTTNAIVEKDFWVVWTLNKLFNDSRLNKILMFKGGTSPLLCSKLTHRKIPKIATLTI